MQDIPKIVVGQSIFRVESDRLFIGGDGPIEVFVVAQGIAKIVVGQGVIRVEPDRSSHSAMGAGKVLFVARKALPRPACRGITFVSSRMAYL